MTIFIDEENQRGEYSAWHAKDNADFIAYIDAHFTRLGSARDLSTWNTKAALDKHCEDSETSYLDAFNDIAVDDDGNPVINFCHQYYVMITEYDGSWRYTSYLTDISYQKAKLNWWVEQLMDDLKSCSIYYTDEDACAARTAGTCSGKMIDLLEIWHPMSVKEGEDNEEHILTKTGTNQDLVTVEDGIMYAISRSVDGPGDFSQINIWREQLDKCRNLMPQNMRWEFLHDPDEYSPDGYWVSVMTERRLPISEDAKKFCANNWPDLKD